MDGLAPFLGSTDHLIDTIQGSDWDYLPPLAFFGTFFKKDTPLSALYFYNSHYLSTIFRKRLVKGGIARRITLLGGGK